MKNASLLITGASSGIGANIAKQLSAAGYELVLLARDQERLGAVASSLSGPSHSIICDLCSEDSISEAYESIAKLKLNQPLRAVINNAGAFLPGSFVETDMKEWDRQYQLSVRGPVYLLKKLLPILAENAPASIVNISSSAANRPVEGTAAYSSMKLSMNMWTQILALELASKQIRVNAVAPGILKTPIQPWHQEDEKSDIVQQVHSLHPIGRIGEYQDLMPIIEFLVSSKSKWTTGSVFTVDGGLSLR